MAVSPAATTNLVELALGDSVAIDDADVRDDRSSRVDIFDRLEHEVVQHVVVTLHGRPGHRHRTLSVRILTDVNIGAM